MEKEKRVCKRVKLYNLGSRRMNIERFCSQERKQDTSLVLHGGVREFVKGLEFTDKF